MPDATRTPFKWLQALQKAKSETSSVKLTISDIIDRCNDPKVTGNVEPTSPRSVDACLRLGIEPDELKFITKQHFLKNLEDPDLAELAFKHHETIRQERLQALQEERKRIVEEGGTGKQPGKAIAVAAEVKGFDSVDIVEKEAKRLEVIKRRQEREFKQMLHFEMMRKELQEKAATKLTKVQERANAERRAKAEKARKWHRLQREREHQRLKEEEEREKEAKKAEVARYEKEMESAARLLASEQERKQVARLKEVERAEKVEKSRKETEALLAKQQAEIGKKKAEMEARDRERERIKLEQQQEAAKRNTESRVKAEARIAAALQNNATILTKRREDFDKKEKEDDERRRQKEAARKAQEAKIRAEEAAKEEQRKKAYKEAQQREAQRVAAILEKQRIKEGVLRELGEKRDHEADVKSLQHQLDLETKQDKVEAMKRRDLYQRMSLLEKINAGTNKARSLVEQRALLQEQRKLANMEASFQRQRLQETVALMQTRKDWSETANIKDILTGKTARAH